MFCRWILQKIVAIQKKRKKKEWKNSSYGVFSQVLLVMRLRKQEWENGKWKKELKKLVHWRRKIQKRDLNEKVGKVQKRKDAV